MPKRYDDFVHTGPGTLAGRYLRLFWQPVYGSWDLAPGRAAPIRILGEEFTLYRGEDGGPHLVGFRCAHRGTQLSVGWVEGDCIRCFYHGWKYDGKGRCVEQPAEPVPFCEKIRIPSYPVREHIGLIFAYLGDGEPPPFPTYPAFEPPALLDLQIYIQPYNNFQDLENAVDPSHVGFVHRDGTEYDSFVPPIIEVEESQWGLSLSSRRGERFVSSHYGMPNILWFHGVPREGLGKLQAITFYVPVDDESHILFDMNAVPDTEAGHRYLEKIEAEAQNPVMSRNELLHGAFRGKYWAEDMRHLGAGHDYISLQDGIAQGGQGVIADRRTERLGRSDVAVIMLRKLWARELRALAEGRPLKQWARPADMVPQLAG